RGRARTGLWTCARSQSRTVLLHGRAGSSARSGIQNGAVSALKISYGNARGQRDATPLGHYLGAIAPIAWAGGADIAGQTCLHRAAPVDAIAQYLRANSDIGDRIQGRFRRHFKAFE